MDFKPFKIGKFLLMERIATGGMAEVYRAKASGAGGFEKPVAVKRIIPTYSQNEEFRRMFEYEARLSSMLTHSNIVQVYDFVKSADTYLLSMEYVDGKNLRQIINKAKKANVVIPVEACVWIMNEVAKGLDYAHKKNDDIQHRPLNIIHRDMSPQNIMISYEGSVKIVDFGIAKAKDRADETRSGVIKGKFGYMSPEQASGDEVDSRTDIFSTGIILYELLTAKRLFAADNDMQTLKRIQECIVQRPTLVNPKIPIELEKIVLKVLAKDRELRFQTAGQLQQKLQEFLNKHYPGFTQIKVEELLQNLFRQEIVLEQKRISQAYRQSIPFSQGQREDNIDRVSGALSDGDMTHSEHEPNTIVTQGEEDSHPNAAVSELNHTQDDISVPDKAAPVVVAEEEERSTMGGEDEEDLASSLNADPSGMQDISFSSIDLGQEGVPEVDLDAELQNSEPKSLESLPGSNVEENDGALDEAVNALADKSAENSIPDFDINSHFSNEQTSQTKSSSDDDATQIRPNNNANPPPTHTPFLNKGLPPKSPAPKKGMGGLSQFDLTGDKEDIAFATTEPTQNTSSNTEPEHSENHFKKVPERPNSTFAIEDRTPSTDVNQAGYHDVRVSGGQDDSTKTLRVFLSVLMFIFVLGGGGYVFLTNAPNLTNAVPRETSGDGEVPLVIEPDEQPAETPKTPEVVRQPSAAEKRPKINQTDESVFKRENACLLNIDSEPQVVDIFIDGNPRGQTPTAAVVPCNQTFKVKLRRQGFEETIETLSLSKQEDRLFLRMRKVPTGTLRVTVSHNAAVFIEDRQIDSISAGDTKDLKLRANRKYTIRFVNEALQLIQIKEYLIKPDVKIEDRINLDN